MSIGLNPVFKKRNVAEEFCDEGVPLLDQLQTLDGLAEELKVHPLGSFSAYPRLEIPEDFEGDPEELTEGIAKSWHSPGEALETVTALISAVEKQPKALPKKSREGVLNGLKALKKSLLAGVEKKSKFHLDAF